MSAQIDLGDGRERFFFPLVGASMASAAMPMLQGELLPGDRMLWAEIERSDAADRLLGRPSSSPPFLAFTFEEAHDDWPSRSLELLSSADALVAALRLGLDAPVVSPRFVGIYRRHEGYRSRRPGIYRLLQETAEGEARTIDEADGPRLEELSRSVLALMNGRRCEVVLEAFDESYAPFLPESSKIRLLCTALEGLLGPPGKAKFKRRFERLESLTQQSFPRAVRGRRLASLRNAVAHYGDLPSGVEADEALGGLRLLSRRALLFMLDGGLGALPQLQEALDG